MESVWGGRHKWDRTEVVMGCFCARNTSERTLCCRVWAFKAKSGSHSLFLLVRWSQQRGVSPWVGLAVEFRCVGLGKAPG